VSLFTIHCFLDVVSKRFGCRAVKWKSVKRRL
jgi:hypothetical protein